ncbi:MFS transporter [Actinokineospora sp. NBRC 105648]|uniref:MFS transporter n=1 Tax=Actinokineospora sp. NBRC 105648 TaxID=3032206 RepID=UPI0024A48AFB|nr:MFS transporter [Actinokineospora sp. NBRC 105648]GLZ39586.1 hypothetical protein Acsp05_32100 [Actinokineospora sp. NBRC 105648]
MFAAMAGAGGATGTVLGGVLTSWLGWRSTFGLNILAGLALAVLAARVVGPTVRRRGAAGGFDLGGALLSTVGLGLLAFALVNTGVDGWTSPRTVVPGVAGVLLLGLFAVVERRVSAPLMPPEVLRRPVLRTANLLSGLAQVVLFPMFFLISVHMQTVLDFTPVQGGLALLPLSVTVILVAGNTGRVIGRFGPRAVMVVGPSSVRCYRLVSTVGTRQASPEVKPWSVMPSAWFIRARWFSSATW